MTDQIDRFDKTPSLMPLRRDLLRRLAHAADEAGSPLRLTSFASVSPDGTPQVRTLVLRHFDSETMTLRFYTDARLKVSSWPDTMSAGALMLRVLSLAKTWYLANSFLVYHPITTRATTPHAALTAVTAS